VNDRPPVAERQIQRAMLRVMAELLPPEAVWLHVPNQGPSPEFTKALMGDGLKPGAPDLLVFYRGKAYGLEIKRPGGFLSARAVHLPRPRPAGARRRALRDGVLSGRRGVRPARLGVAGRRGDGGGDVAALSRSARRALAWLLPNQEPRALAGAWRPGRSTMAGLRRRALVEPLDAGGTVWRRTARGDAEAARL
jgi:hypothetical protein